MGPADQVGAAAGCCAGGVEFGSCPCTAGDETDADADASGGLTGTTDCCPAAGKANKEPTRNVHRYVYIRKRVPPFDSSPNGRVNVLSWSSRSATMPSAKACEALREGCLPSRAWPQCYELGSKHRINDGLEFRKQDGVCYETCRAGHRRR